MSLNQDSLDSLKIERNHRAANSGSGALKWSLVVCLLIIGVVVAVWFTRGTTLEVETVTAMSATTSGSGAAAILDASGYVVARRAATVSSKVTGKIADVLIEEGMKVEDGQIVARLDDKSLRPLLALAETQLEATKRELDEIKVRQAEAGRNMHRIEELRKKDLASEAEFDRARSEVEALDARLKALQSQIQVADATVRVRQQELDDLLVRAPFSGVIVSKDAQPGEMVSPVSAGGGFTRTGIATLVDMDSREIEVDVNESYINRVSDGQKTEAVLDAYPNWRIPSHVINIVPTADRQKATVKVRIAFDELDARILPNMGVKVSFLDSATVNEVGEQSEKPAVLIPSSAVMRDGSSAIVWRVRNGALERVAVLTGNERSGQVEVTSGISAGDTVVKRQVAGLAAGVEVKEISK